MAQVVNLIPVGGRFLKLQVPGRLLHGIHQVVDDGRVLAFQEHGGVADILLVLLRCYVTHARGRAPVNLILQARPVTVPEIAFTTRSYAENLLQDIKAFLDGTGAWKRPEPGTAALFGATTAEGQRGIVAVRRQVDIGVGFVIPKQDRKSVV